LGVEVLEVDGLVGLVDKILSILSGLPPDRFLWFRGLNRSNLELLPKLMRDGKEVEQIFERERRLLTRFRQRSLAYWPAGYPQTDWEQLFAMQHYGMPTRLLDWTENLFVAAYFAMGAPIDDTTSHAVVWCIDPVAWNRQTPVLSEFGETVHVLTTADEESDSYRPETTKRRNKSPVTLFGTHNSQRIVAQRGTFVIWGNESKCLEQFAEELKGQLWKIIVHGDRKELAKSLNGLGFGETMVFPEMTSLAVELDRTEGWRR
jgi:FRG domain-containing protein